MPMPISGTFAAMTATSQPMAAKPAPVDRHGQMTQPDNNWSALPDSTGGGYGDPAPVDPAMTGRGLELDLGHKWGHGATAAIRKARAPFSVSKRMGGRVDAADVVVGAAQDAAANAHRDSTAGYYQGHMYDPLPQQTGGAGYTVSPNNVRAIPSFGARTVIHGRPGGQHMDGDGGEFAPTGFPTGEAGRWAVAHYSSPALGAMYSRNTLRGILPQMVATPYNQPAISGPSGTKAAGIPSNARNLAKPFTTPALFRSPASESDSIIAAAPPVPEIGPVMGVGL